MAARCIVFVLAASVLTSGCSAKDHVTWESFSHERLEAARLSGRPTIVYFYAAWCPPCHELKRKTFSDPGVIESLTGFERLKADMSFQRSEEVMQIARQFGVTALPLIRFFDRNGAPVRDFSFSGFVSPRRFRQALAERQDLLYPKT